MSEDLAATDFNPDTRRSPAGGARALCGARRRGTARAWSGRRSLHAQRAAERAYDAQSPRPQGRPPAFAARIEAAVSDLLQAEAEQTEARAHQSEARAMIRELGTLFHPYDLEHGQVQPVAQVAARFADLWARLARLAKAADVPTRRRDTSPRRSV